MSERFRPSQENVPSRAIWVPMREKELGYQEKALYAGVKWNPNSIYNAKNLAIDVVGVNDILLAMKMRKDIEIVPLNHRDELEVQIGKVNKQGETTLAGSASKNKQQPQSDILWDQEMAGTKVFLNFKDMYDQAVKTKGKLDVNSQYAKNVDETFKKILPWVLAYNFIDMKGLDGPEKSALLVDTGKVIINTVTTGVGILTISTLGLMDKQHDVMAVLNSAGGLIITSVLTNQMYSLMSLSKRPWNENGEENSYNYKRYLLDFSSKNLFLSYLTKISLPHYYFENLFLPYGQIKGWKNPLFKAI